MKKNVPVTIITILALLIFAFTLVHAVYYAPDSELSVPAIAKIQSARNGSSATSSLPTRLIIPSINVDAVVEEVGFTFKGNMGVPDNFTDVGWYKYGTLPGDIGSAVIDGHVDDGLALPGVFKNLSNIKIGDDIYVLNQAGQKLHFVVTDVSTYGYKNAPTTLIFNQTGDVYLKLITCTGNWVPEDRTDDQRLVVSAKML